MEEHIIVNKTKNRTLTTAKCLTEGCDWAPKNFSECDEHVRDTGHPVRIIEVWETVGSLSPQSQPRNAEV
jgi:hypothetical protein